jgi:hypothetical protein
VKHLPPHADVNKYKHRDQIAVVKYGSVMQRNATNTDFLNKPDILGKFHNSLSGT